MSFKPSSSVDPDRIFITHSSSLVKRWDPFYHVPSLVAIEERVSAKTSVTLRHFIERMAGGATPSKTNAEEHYTDGPEGIPFIRVQNLTTKGVLSLDNCKHITRSTHEGLLRRSRLSGGELLVKITGVGRMAVASVVPENFEANINQHMVAIKTKNLATSELLAAWLNLDVAEKLASRRATGGTRPALDYLALKSIPVIQDPRIPSLINEAVSRSESKINKAKQLLASIDKILLDRLGITIPEEPPDTVNNRIFHRQFSEVSGRRLDPFFYSNKFKNLECALDDGIHKPTSLDQVCLSITNGVDCRDFTNKGIPYVKVGDIRPFEIDVDQAQKVPLESIPTRGLVKKGDLLLTRKGTFGVAAIVKTDQPFAVSSEVFRITLKTSMVHSSYVVAILNSFICQEQFNRHKIGAIMGSLTQVSLRQIRLPIPRIDKKSDEQLEISEIVMGIREQATRLVELAQIEVVKAKADVEGMILGEGGASK